MSTPTLDTSRPEVSLLAGMPRRRRQRYTNHWHEVGRSAFPSPPRTVGHVHLQPPNDLLRSIADAEALIRLLDGD